jgi:hypothetical protein
VKEYVYVLFFLTFAEPAFVQVVWPWWRTCTLTLAPGAAGLTVPVSVTVSSLATARVVEIFMATRYVVGDLPGPADAEARGTTPAATTARTAVAMEGRLNLMVEPPFVPTPMGRRWGVDSAGWPPAATVDPLRTASCTGW